VAAARLPLPKTSRLARKPTAKPTAAAAASAAVAPPRIVVNAKAYLEVSSAAGCLRLARACARAAEATGAGIALAPPLAELAGLARRSLGVPIYGQHCDAREPGAATGWVTAEALAAAGAVGSIVNHAEHKLPHADVERIVSRLSAAGLASLVCADSLAEARALAAFKPTMLAVEPPELIGGDVSVTSADPAIVRDAVKAVRQVAPKTLVLCGAGVKTGADVAAALRLGAHGVLLASGVVKAKDPLAALKDLAAPLTPPSLRAR
jgi:triosephosphate isomerase (TIM)